MFKAFFKPKWQHPKAEVRRHAIESLASNQTDKLITIAKTDADPQLRCLAVAKLSDLNILADIQRTAQHTEVQQLAHQRCLKIMTGEIESTATPTQCLNHFRQANDNDAFKSLILLAKEEKLRLVILKKFDEQSLYADVIKQDASAHNRLFAAERLNDATLMQTVSKQIKNRDKRVHRLLKDKLQSLREQAARPQQLRAQRAPLFTHLQRLCRLQAWSRNAAEFQHIKQAGAALAKQAAEWQCAEDVAQVAEFEQLSLEFQTGLEAWTADQAANASIYTAKKAVIAEAKTLLETLETQTAAFENVSTQLSDIETTWASSGDLDNAETRALKTTYHTQLTAIRQHINAVEKTQKLAATLRKINQQADNWLGDKNKPLREKAIKQWQSAGQAVNVKHETDADLQTLNQRFEQLNNTLREHLKQQKERYKQQQESLKICLEALQVALDAGSLKEAETQYKCAKKLLDQLSDLPRHQLQHWTQQFQTIEHGFRQLKGWQRWGNQRGRETLCEEVEAMIGSDEAPDRLASNIKALQDEWKKLQDGSRSQSLWTRFQKACHTAYEPCVKHFDEKAQTRDQNRQAREALCVELETLDTQADWKAMDFDWKKAYQFVKHQRKTWFGLGHIDRQQRKVIDRRFDAAMAAVEKHLDQERQRNKHQREALIKQVQALQTLEPINKAIDEVKKLQKKWVISVPDSRQAENALWTTFRGAADAVFERRRAVQNAENKSLQDNLQAKKAVCTALETALNAEPELLMQALHKAESAWHDAGETPKSAQKSLQQHYCQLKQKIEETYTEWLHESKMQQIKCLQAKALICQDCARGLLDASAAETAWEALPILSAFEKQMRSIFDAALAGSLMGEVDHAARQLLCVRLELSAGVESPTEDADLRMKYQVERLSAAMGGGADEAVGLSGIITLAQTWYTQTVLPAEDEAGLEKRFDAVFNAALEKG